MGDTITGWGYSMSGWGTQLHTQLQQCITVYTVTHTVYQCFMQRALQEGVATWRDSPQVAANTRLSPRLHQMFSTLLVSMSSPSRFLCFPHFYFWIWASRPTLYLSTCGIRALGLGQMLMVLSRRTQPTTPPSLRPNCLKLNILGLSWPGTTVFRFGF